MKRIIKLSCFAGIGIILGSTGLTVVDWELYATLLLSATASLTAEIKE